MNSTAPLVMSFLHQFLKTIGIASILLAIGMPVTNPLLGQPIEDSASRNYFWVSGGPAITTLGPGLTAGATVASNRNLFSVRAISTDHTFGKETWEVALLYGRAISSRQIHFSAGTGVAVVGGTSYSGIFETNSAADLEPIIGFPVEARIYWTPVNFGGIGINGFANINTGQPFGGLALFLRLGHFQ